VSFWSCMVDATNGEANKGLMQQAGANRGGMSRQYSPQTTGDTVRGPGNGLIDSAIGVASFAHNTPSMQRTLPSSCFADTREVRTQLFPAAAACQRTACTHDYRGVFWEHFCWLDWPGRSELPGNWRACGDCKGLGRPWRGPAGKLEGPSFCLVSNLTSGCSTSKCVCAGSS
jgi:hypothetical protein